MKKILITGAGTGLGKELAKIYAKDNNHIILVARRSDKLNEVKKEIEKEGFSASVMTCDISNYSEVQELRTKLIKDNYKIDYLINNAGVGYFGALEDLKLEELNTMIDVNVKGTIMLTKELLPYIKERIINIISTAGLKGKPNEAVYVASKFAIRGFSESLVKELEGKELKVTAVYMGGMNTPFWDDSTHIKDKLRLKSPKEVAKIIKEQDDGRNEIIVPK